MYCSAFCRLSSSLYVLLCLTSCCTEQSAGSIGLTLCCIEPFLARLMLCNFEHRSLAVLTFCMLGKCPDAAYLKLCTFGIHYNYPGIASHILHDFKHCSCLADLTLCTFGRFPDSAILKFCTFHHCADLAYIMIEHCPGLASLALFSLELCVDSTYNVLSWSIVQI